MRRGGSHGRHTTAAKTTAAAASTLGHTQLGRLRRGQRDEHGAQHRLWERLHDRREAEGLVERLHTLHGRIEMAHEYEAIRARAHILLEELPHQRAAFDVDRAQQRVQMQVAHAVSDHELGNAAGVRRGTVRDGIPGQVHARRRHVLHAHVRLIAPEPQTLEEAIANVGLRALGHQLQPHDVAEDDGTIIGEHTWVVCQAILEPRLAEQVYLHCEAEFLSRRSV